MEDTIFYDDYFHYSVVLNTEFMTAADFLFDGLESMIYVTYFQSYSESKIFKSYYQIAVGIERIQKIILNLAYNQLEGDKKQEFSSQINKAFYGHNHEQLNNLLIQYMGIKTKLQKQENRFLSQLMEFYSTHRYSKFQKDTELTSLFKFHTGESFQMNTEKFHVRLNEIFDSVEKILSFYFDILDIIQSKVQNYLGEVGVDAKLFVIYNFSNVLKSFFKLFILAKLEYRNRASDFCPLYTPAEKSLSSIDIYFGGNGSNVIYGLFDYYYRTVESRNWQDFDIPLPFRNGDKKKLKSQLSELAKIISYYENRNPDIHSFWGL